MSTHYRLGIVQNGVALEHHDVYTDLAEVPAFAKNLYDKTVSGWLEHASQQCQKLYGAGAAPPNATKLTGCLSKAQADAAIIAKDIQIVVMEASVPPTLIGYYSHAGWDNGLPQLPTPPPLPPPPRPGLIAPHSVMAHLPAGVSIPAIQFQVKLREKRGKNVYASPELTVLGNHTTPADWDKAVGAVVCNWLTQKRFSLSNWAAELWAKVSGTWVHVPVDVELLCAADAQPIHPPPQTAPVTRALHDDVGDETPMNEQAKLGAFPTNVTWYGLGNVVVRRQDGTVLFTSPGIPGHSLAAADIKGWTPLRDYLLSLWSTHQKNGAYSVCGEYKALIGATDTHFPNAPKQIFAQGSVCVINGQWRPDESVVQTDTPIHGESPNQFVPTGPRPSPSHFGPTPTDVMPQNCPNGYHWDYQQQRCVQTAPFHRGNAPVALHDDPKQDETATPAEWLGAVRSIEQDETPMSEQSTLSQTMARVRVLLYATGHATPSTVVDEWMPRAQADNYYTTLADYLTASKKHILDARGPVTMKGGHVFGRDMVAKLCLDQACVEFSTCVACAKAARLYGPGNWWAGLGALPPALAEKTAEIKRWKAPFQVFRWLGATAPYPVCKWFPGEDICTKWDQFPSDQQDAAMAQAKSLEANQQAQAATIKKEGGCDATKPGRLAGALKEYLLKKGGDSSKMDADPAVFGPGECAEWMRVFGKAPTFADAKTVGTTTLNGVTLSITDVCGNKVTLPTCAAPAPPKPDCEAGYQKDASGNCVPIGPTGCKNQADCPPGKTCVNGECLPTTASSSSGSGLGLLLLGAAVVGIGFIASRGELKSLGKPPQQRLDNSPRVNVTKAEALADFRAEVMPHVVAKYGANDVPALREAWVNYTDGLHRAGYITRTQVDNWTNPF